ncbi:hypothetical protein EDD16DRAFT_1520815 [Pisolithus croceorrhizus]|nr:hypothetical protein EV401DRAFT_1895599 [Pisolithus croceorrhizus]KAI6115092.1 hypothetical protein EDD16DRAFT_1520815 [Pisolithus croceorrhizus]KAI6154423.1 hypothetical protein EDD17DRAFT_1512844 [Pisolithus thermaeus]
MTGTTSNIIEPQDENVGSPHSKSDSREVMPAHGEPPAIDQGGELLATESSDNGGQADQGEAANTVEATAVAGEAQPVVVAEGGIGGEHHQMTEENSGECPTEGEGATKILASKQQVGEGLDPHFWQGERWITTGSNHYRGWGSQTGGTSLWQLLTATALESEIRDYMIELPEVDE